MSALVAVYERDFLTALNGRKKRTKLYPMSSHEKVNKRTLTLTGLEKLHRRDPRPMGKTSSTFGAFFQPPVTH